MFGSERFVISYNKGGSSTGKGPTARVERTDLGGGLGIPTSAAGGR